MLSDKLRIAVGQWFRFKYEHDQSSRNLLLNMIRHNPTIEPERVLEHILSQIAADIDHSELLLRMLDLQEPMSEAAFRLYAEQHFHPGALQRQHERKSNP